MSALIVTGSPREGMFSDRIGDMYKSLTDGKLVHLRKEKIGPCHACEYCKEINEGECIQKDDMTPLYKTVRESDTVAIFSPVYWWQTSAQTKLFIDRLYALEDGALEGKKLVVVLNGADDDESEQYEKLRDLFSMMAQYLKMDFYFLGIGTPSEEEWEKKKDKVESFLKSTL